MFVEMAQSKVATEQEMKAKVVEAEAQIPVAMADAFQKGNLGIMDNYKMKNIMADTQMRDKIGSGPKSTQPEGDEPKK